jgi:hypothetical protein
MSSYNSRLLYTKPVTWGKTDQIGALDENTFEDQQRQSGEEGGTWYR